MKENFIHRKYNAAFNYGTTVTSRNIIQQQKLAACVWELVMASHSGKIRISSLVVCIFVSYEGGLGF